MQHLRKEKLKQSKLYATGARRVRSSFGAARPIYSYVLRAIVTFCGSVVTTFAEPARPNLSPTNIFAPVSTPAQSIFDLSRLVLMVTPAIFVVFFTLLAYSAVTFRKGRASDGREPAEAYGSTQVDLAWTVITIVI